MDEAGQTESYLKQSESRGTRLLQIAPFILIASLYVGARIWHLASACLWFDEIFSVHAARYNWARMLSFVAADVVHPPAFYALLKVWIGIGGESLIWLRLLPALLSVAAIVPFVLLCRELGVGRGELYLALLLMAINGYLIKYAQEVRMYSLLLLLTLTSLWLFVKLLRSEVTSRREILVLFAINLLLVYTHYFGWMVVALESFYLYFRGHTARRRFLLSAALLLLCFSPWVYAVASAERGQGLAQNIGWVARPRAADLAQFFEMLNEPFYYRQSSAEQPFALWGLVGSLLLFGLPLIALIWRELKKSRGEGTVMSGSLLWLLCFSFLPLILAFALSWVLPQSIWGTRHLIIVAGPYAILAALSISRLRPAEAKYTVAILLSSWLFLAGVVMLIRREVNNIWCAWEQLGVQATQGRPRADETIRVY
ncbi:MAG: glycosyltransferase family 39 protein, partial [Acidobacteriota bacterium]|nr:glycosyltransferase family 39 protein [Acidobacteriota bacterium]